MKELTQLVKQAIHGDDDAFLQVMNRYKADLYRTALAFLKREHDALEAVQEVTYRAYKRLNSIKEPAYVKTWLIRIMINYCNDQLKIHRHFLRDEAFVEMLPYKKDDEALLELEDAIMRLNKRSREIIILKYFHELKIKEIASTMNRSEGTVKTWLHKALKSLRKELTEKGGSARA